ncbi:MAG TPA: hypothetical protein VK003_05095 [Oceanobacillus sp.]|nr:hypothetical protein [Oceanobacillus sp.]
MTKLLQKAIDELHKLPEQRQDEVAAWILEKLADESDWEDVVLTNSLGDALNPNGSINFDKLRSKGKTVTLTE